MSSIFQATVLVAMKIGQYASAIAILCVFIILLNSYQRSKDRRRFGLDRPTSRTEFGQEVVEVRRTIMSSGYQDFIIKWMRKFLGVCVVIAVLSFVIYLASK